MNFKLFLNEFGSFLRLINQQRKKRLIYFVFSEDYQEFNQIRLNELENFYKAKLDRIRRDQQRKQQEQPSTKPSDIRTIIDSTKKEHQTLVEQNHSLSHKFGKTRKTIEKQNFQFFFCF